MVNQSAQLTCVHIYVGCYIHMVGGFRLRTSLMGKEGWAFLGWEDHHRPLCVESILLMWLKMFWVKVRKATVMWLSLGGFTQFLITIQNNLHGFNMSIHLTWRITPYTNKQAQLGWQSNPGLQTDFTLTTRFPPPAPYGLCQPGQSACCCTSPVCMWTEWRYYWKNTWKYNERGWTNSS